MADHPADAPVGRPPLDADRLITPVDWSVEIVEEAAAWSADLVVLGSRGLTGLSRFVLGSVARNVLQSTQSSVLIVRESGSAPTDG